MSFTNRFSAIDKAMITAIGNTLAVCGDTQAPNINTSDLITASGGRTRDWAQCGSSSVLSIPSDGAVLFAELLWYSTVKSSDATATDCRTIQNSSVTFETPLGQVRVAPTSTQSYAQPSGSVNHFRSADVTSMLQASRSGTYTLSKIPTSLPPTGLSDTTAGWALTVVYQDNSLSPVKIDYSSGIQAINSATPYQKAYIGFESAVDPVEFPGCLLVNAANAGPLTAAETLKAGASFASLSALGNAVGSGHQNPGTEPNNPYDNMFAGLINLCDPSDANFGLINVTGSNGSQNHDGFIPSQRNGARNKWDMAGIPLGATLGVAQNQLAVQIEAAGTTSDIQLVSMASMISVTAPDIDTTFSIFNSDGISLHEVELGEKLIYSVSVKNNGTSTAENVTLSAVLDSACRFIPESFKLNGAPVDQADIAAGVNIGTIAPSGVQAVIFAVTVNSMPSNKQISAHIDYRYQFTSGEGSPVYTTRSRTQAEVVNVLAGKLTVVKSCSKGTAEINSTLDYTAIVTNTGTASAANILFQDVLPASCTLVAGSVKVDGTTHASYDTNIGFALPDLDAGEVCEVKFGATVDAVPMSFEVGGRSAITYQYLYAAALAPRILSLYSNYVGTRINHAEIIAVRCSDNNYPQVGDTVDYTLSLTNTGNISSSEVTVHEPLPTGTAFVAGSVYVNGVLKSDYNPFSGFQVGSVLPQKTTTVNYSIVTNQISPTEVIENIANVPFNYQLSSQNPVIESVMNSNKAITRTKYVQVSGQEVVDKAYAVIGDLLFYQISITNSGNVNAFNTLFLSDMATGVTFVPNSVTVNGLPVLDVNPGPGFTVGTICPGDTMLIAFNATAVSIPSPNVVYNSSNLIFDYLPDPLGPHITETMITNTVSTILNRDSLLVEKTVDKSYAALEDSLVYTTTLSNTGTVPLKNIFFIDYMVQALSFRKGSVLVSGASRPSFDPTIGFYLGDIPPESSVTVSFLAKVASLPITGYVQNKSSITYTSQVDPDSAILRTTRSSNDVVTTIQKGELTVAKKVSAAYAKIGDTLTYTVNVSNTGNITSNILSFVDVIPAGTVFVTGSVSVNGQLMPLYDPGVGFPLSSINPGQVAVVQFKTTVSSVPLPNVISNAADLTFSYLHMPDGTVITSNLSSNLANTTVNKSDSSITKTVDRSFAAVNDLIRYTVRVQNSGTVPMQAVAFTDLLPQGAQFVAGSVYLNGVSQPSFNPASSFSLGTIQSSETVMVQFSAKVTGDAPASLQNSASVSYQYALSPTAAAISVTKASNLVSTSIKALSITDTLTASKQYAGIGDTITYTSVLQTTGNTAVSGVQFTDILPPQVQFVAGSVKVNGQTQATYNPTNGFALGDIPPNTPVRVVFDVTVTDAPPNLFLYNKSDVYYQYRVDPAMPLLSGNQSSNTVSTQIAKGTLTVTASANRANAIVSDVVRYSFLLSNTGNTSLKNLSLKDILQSDSMLQPNTIYVNGVLSINADMTLGIPVGTLNVGRTAKVELDVQVKSVPADGLIRNKGTVAYSYNIDPGAPAISATLDSNTTSVTVDSTIVSLSVQTDKTIVRVNDTLAYTVKVVNTGTVPAQSINFRDILDPSLGLVTNSVTINDVAQTGYDPNAGFLLPNIAPSATTTVKFTVTVTGTPTDNALNNYASVNYSYEAQSGQPAAAVSTSSNTVQTFVAVGVLQVQKDVSKAYATLNDTLIYTVKITNTGTVNATSLNFTDTIPASTVFVGSSLWINGVAQPSYSPNSAFPLTDLLPRQSHTVAFQVRVSSVPSAGTITNKSDVGFSYRLLSSTPIVTTAISSNTVSTQILLGTLSVTKAVDKAFAAVGDGLLYTLTITNAGNTLCNHIRLTDAVTADALFLINSVSINGSVQSGYDPSNGFSIPDIPAGGSAAIQFGVSVKNLPANGLLLNAAVTDYQFLIDPAQPASRIQAISQIAQTTVNQGSLSLVKLVNKQYASLGDILRYTIILSNTGTVPNTAINFRDIIKTGGTFITGSVTIDGAARPELNPYESFSLGTLNSGESTTVAFNVRLTAIPQFSTMLNTATAIYTYHIDPNGVSSVAQADSNTVVTTVNQPILTVTKAVDKAYAKGGDSLLYTVTLLNSGNINLTNLTLTDILQTDITLEAGSVTVDGVSRSSADPADGLILGTLVPLASKEVKFRATIAASGSQESIKNSSVGTYSYQIAPDGEIFTISTQSNTVATEVRKYGIAIASLVDMAYATLGDTLNYTVVVKNIGNSTAYGLQLANVISDGARVTTGSVLVNDIPYPAYDPIAGFALDDMVKGATATVKFAAKVTSLPQTGLVTGQSSATGSYRVDPAGQGSQLSALSNTVQTVINVASLSHVTTVSKAYAQVGDVISYTSVLTSTGNIGVSNVWFYDALPSSLSFVNGSIRINGNTNASLTLATGFTVGNLPPAQSVTIDFQVKITKLPDVPAVTNTTQSIYSFKIDPNGSTITKTIFSNPVPTNVIQSVLSIIKNVDQTIVTVGDTLTYTIQLTNLGNTIANGAMLHDTLSSGAIYLPGSVKFNGESRPLYNPIVGVDVGNIGIGNSVTLSFKATVASIPASGTITNQAAVNYSFLLDPKQPPIPYTAHSNTTATSVVKGELAVLKTVDKKYATVGDILTYVVTVTNVGNIDATSIMFIDPIPQNAIFVIATIKVNGVNQPSYNPEAGFQLHTMKPGEVITVEYQVEVVNN